MEKRNAKALLPIAVFVVLYLGLGILFEYGLNIEMGFYKIPVVIIFLLALLVACLQNRKLSLNDKLKIMGVGISDPNIITMIIIFMLAGIFVGVVGRTSANSVAYFILSLIPPQFAVVVLFVVSCFVSLAMGTSVGTITLITPSREHRGLTCRFVLRQSWVVQCLGIICPLSLIRQLPRVMDRVVR